MGWMDIVVAQAHRAARITPSLATVRAAYLALAALTAPSAAALTRATVAIGGVR